LKKVAAATLIGLICITVLGVHAWWTWGEIDSLPGRSRSDREFFEYSLFLESFAFMISAAYFFGPKIYRFFGEPRAAARFEGEKQSVSKPVLAYSAAGVLIRRIGFDPQMGVPPIETVLAILGICIPPIVDYIRRRHDIRRKTA
jgi:hypothetical protein